MHQVIISGNVSFRGELKEFSKPDGTISTVINFSVAIHEGKKTTFLDCEAFNGLSKIIKKHVNVGDRVAVIGKINVNTFPTENGKKTAYRIRANEVDFMNNNPKAKDTDTEETVQGNSETKAETTGKRKRLLAPMQRL